MVHGLVVVNKAKKTADDVASENGKAKIAKFIAYKAGPSTRNSITPDTAQYGTDRANALLHAAADDGKIDVVKWFFEHGVDFNGRDANNQTPLHGSAQNGNPHVVRLLIERGARVDLCDNWGSTPLHEASPFGLLEISWLLVDHDAK